MILKHEIKYATMCRVQKNYCLALFNIFKMNNKKEKKKQLKGEQEKNKGQFFIHTVFHKFPHTRKKKHKCKQKPRENKDANGTAKRLNNLRDEKKFLKINICYQKYLEY